MRRRSPSSSSRDRRSRRSRSEDRRSNGKREEERDKRREAWLLQQEREREHEILKKKMILEYELKRAALLKKQRTNGSPRSRTPSPSTSRCKDRSKSFYKPTIMSEKFDTSGGSEPLFRGPSTFLKPTEAELKQIIVDIHRNISGPVDINSDLQRDINNPEDVIVKRRDDEGKIPIFSRFNLNQSETSDPKNEETRTIRDINIVKINNSNRRSSSKSRTSSPESHSSLRRERSVYNQRKRSQRRSKSSDSSDNDCRGRYQRNGKRERSNDRARSSSHYRDRSSYSSKRRSSREKSHSTERRREDLSRLTRIETVREHRGRSRERRESYRQYEREYSEGRSREMASYPHYVEQIPVPVYYGNFPRPVMMPMIPMRGPPPPLRNRPPFGARFPPRFINPRFPPNPRFNRQF
ncbi:zinc finger CCCH domain-containing protein 18-like isoform X2 [Leptopilina boulardi]|uniref:zinc finger CCCH domain-containing protein 18-like isoform X2 n=1 Tax=Leptopilina boulardi TaxID=63433 RepID=UPI0021F5EF15|nr:zinc finger CCCH domain-containing protein 18-like isoform X2 [Leptopilina boulardi]